jgi:hypothetical protein
MKGWKTLAVGLLGIGAQATDLLPKGGKWDYVPWALMVALRLISTGPAGFFASK